MKKVRQLCKVILVTLLASVTLPALPATATGTGYVQFGVTGWMPKVPCPEGCSASLSGNGGLAAHAEVLVGEDVHTATFMFAGTAIQGSISYVEPAFPVCTSPLASGRGTMTIYGPVIGEIAGSRGVGTVDWVEFRLDFHYERIGVSAVVFVDNGSMTFSYSLPHHSGSFTSSVVLGTGAATIQSSPGITTLCAHNGPVFFGMYGDIFLPNP